MIHISLISLGTAVVDTLKAISLFDLTSILIKKRGVTCKGSEFYFFRNEIFIFKVFLFSLFASSLNAAEISLKNNPEMGCNILVDGPIEAGDADKLSELLIFETERHYLNPTNQGAGTYDKRVCFNSMGGSLSEALRIVEVLRQYGAGSAVGRNEICESACAIAFLGGYLNLDDGMGTLNRVIHPTARLGFHAPSLAVPVGQFNEEQVGAAFRVALSSIDQLFRLSRKYDDLLPPSLLSIFLRTPSDEMRYSDTVFDASSWKILVSPVSYPDAETFEYIGNRSRHYYEGSGPSAVLPVSPYLEGLGNACFNHMFSVHQPSKITFSGMASQSIDVVNPFQTWGELMLNVGNDEVFYIWVGNLGLPGDHFLQCDVNLVKNSPAFQLYPPATHLSALYGIEGVSKAEFDALLHLESRTDACWLTSPTARITNVNDYVNLRRQPDFAASVIRQVPLGEQVLLTELDDVTIIGDQRNYDACVNACQAFARNLDDRRASDRVQRCINDNQLWYEVTDTRGTRGWVSRKFLEEVQ